MILPLLCPDCNNTYSMDLNEQPLFSCHMRDRGAHNCDKIKEFHASLPKTIPKGFVWICPACVGDTVSEGTSTLEPGNLVLQETSVNGAQNNTALVVDQNDTALLAEQTSESNHSVIKNQATNSMKTTTTKVCPRYRRGVCPHGLRGSRLIEGQTCGFDHPRVCRKYSSFGSRGPKGCKLDSNCKFYHPILCRYSVRERLCTNEKCTFVHLKGTKRHRDDEIIPTVHKQVPILTGGNSSRVSPKNDSLDRIEAMIKDLKISQEAEINKMKQELSYIKSLNIPRWGVMPPWHQSLPQGYHAQMQSPNFQSIPVPPQGSIQVPNGTQTRVGQPMGGAPPGGIVAPPSCY